MKKILIAALVMLFAGAALYAADYAKAEKRFAQNVIKRTSTVILNAQKAVKKGKVYTGDLAKSVRHQRFAIYLFNRGEYDRSVRQSLRARQLAYAAMKANRVRYREDISRDERRVYITLNIGQLDIEIDRDMPRDRDRYYERDHDDRRDMDRDRDRMDDRDRNRDQDRDRIDDRNRSRDNDRDMDNNRDNDNNNRDKDKNRDNNRDNDNNNRNKDKNRDNSSSSKDNKDKRNSDRDEDIVDLNIKADITEK